MHSEPSVDALIDILRNIDLARQFTSGMDYAAFYHDTRTVYAVTRCLEIISEASRRLSPEIKSRHTEIPWTDVAGAGNVYRHQYEDVLERQLWQTLQYGLVRLRSVAEEELQRLGKA